MPPNPGGGGDIGPRRRGAANVHQTGTSLRSRAPGQSAMAQLRRLEAGRSRRGLLRRLLGLGALSREGRSWYQGALGEIAAARELARLGPRWLVLHAVPVGAADSDIDHVAIGPAGVYTINTKHHAGQDVAVSEALWVSGQRTDHLRNSRHEAGRAARLLGAATGRAVVVRPIVAIHGAKRVTIRRRPRDVEVLTVRHLTRWLAKQRPRLTEEDAAAIRSAAEDPRTWRTRLVPGLEPAPEDSMELRAWFDRLDGTVRAARRRRIVVGIAGFSVVAAVILRSVAALPPGLVAALIPG
ncbi:nuclease-related domain-containing protein [Georgenia ruanii]|nr:nuclease-related domain-containing protein [Georgenia ruanii]